MLHINAAKFRTLSECRLRNALNWPLYLRISNKPLRLVLRLVLYKALLA